MLRRASVGFELGRVKSQAGLDLEEEIAREIAELSLLSQRCESGMSEVTGMASKLEERIENETNVVTTMRLKQSISAKRARQLALNSSVHIYIYIYNVEHHCQHAYSANFRVRRH